MARFYRTAAFAALIDCAGPQRRDVCATDPRDEHCFKRRGKRHQRCAAPRRRRERCTARLLAELWPHAGRDALQPAEADRYDTNAKRLGLAWSYVVGAGGGNQEGTPLMWNNTLYGITTWSVVYALDARTGKELWRWDPEVNQTAVRPEDLLRHRESRHRALQRHDHRAGHRRTPVRAGRDDGQAGVGNARGVSAGSVHVDHGAAHRRRQGDHRRVRRRQAHARHSSRVDAQTGHLAWRFYTVPGDPSKPSENEAMRAAAQDLGRRLLQQRRRRRGVGRLRLRSRRQSGLRRHGQRRAVGAEIPRRAERGQSVHLLDPGGRSDHRPAQVALPDRAERQLGFRQRAAVDAAGSEHQRTHAQGDHAGVEERLLLCAGSRHRRVHLRRIRS